MSDDRRDDDKRSTGVSRRQLVAAGAVLAGTVGSLPACKPRIEGSAVLAGGRNGAQSNSIDGLSRIFHFNINVSDIDYSIAFYTMLGFEFEPFVGGDFTGTDMTSVYGLQQKVTRMKFYHLRLPPVPLHVGYVDGAQARQPAEPTRIDLVQWMDPKAHGEPLQDLTGNGIARISLHTTNIDGWYAHLKKQGVKFLTDKGPTRFGGPSSPVRILPFYDPDGVILQLLEGIA